MQDNFTRHILDRERKGTYLSNWPYLKADTAGHQLLIRTQISSFLNWYLRGQLLQLSQQLLGNGSATGLSAPAPAQKTTVEPALRRAEHPLVHNGRPQIVRHDRVKHILSVSVGVGLLPGDQLPERDPERVDVGVSRHPFALQKLRGPVSVRAADVAQERTDSAHLAAAVKFQRTAKVGYFAHVSGGHQHVGWFYVQVRDAVGVKEAQTLRDVRGVSEPPVLPQLSASAYDLLQIPAPHKLHQNRPDAAFVSKIRGHAGGRRDDADDVLVAQVRRVEFGPEALAGRQLVFRALLDFLQRHRFPEVVRLVDGTEATGANGLHRSQLLPEDHGGPEATGDFAVEPLHGNL